MSEDISGFGVSVRIIATNTFPIGLLITQYADDADAIDLPSIDIAGAAMGLNGDKVNWTSANIIPMTLNVITGSQDDQNLALLFEANRAGRNKTSAKDSIIAIVDYPGRKLLTLTGGSCMSFMGGPGVAAEGRFKTNAYVFNFENRIYIP